MNIDWSKAPEATHYLPRLDDSGMYNAVFWRLEGDVGVEAWTVRRSGAVDTHHSRPHWPPEILSRLIPRPAKPEPAPWSGEGLPPVGVDAEFRSHDGQWLPGQYIGQFKGQMVVGCHATGSVGFLSSEEFRPIRTAEQIAAEERGAAIEEMVSLFNAGRTAADGFAAVYRAGYRKQAAQ